MLNKEICQTCIKQTENDIKEQLLRRGMSIDKVKCNMGKEGGIENIVVSGITGGNRSLPPCQHQICEKKCPYKLEQIVTSGYEYKDIAEINRKEQLEKYIKKIKNPIEKEKICS